MDANVMDTLRDANRLKEVWFETPKAAALARALGDELRDSVVTQGVVQQELQPSRGKLVEFEFKFDAIDARFDSIDARFELIDDRLNLTDRADDARFWTLETKMGASHREMDGKFKMLLAAMIFGFTPLTGLDLYNATAAQAATVERTTETVQWSSV